MASKQLESSSSEGDYSSDEENASMVVKKQQDPCASSSVVASPVKTSAESSSEEEESSEEEKEKETASRVVVAAAVTAKRKAVLSAEEQEDGDVAEKTRKKKGSLSKVDVVAQARSDMAKKKKKKKKATVSNEVVKHQRKKAKTYEEDNVAVVVETVNVKKEEIQGASSGKKLLFQPLLEEKDRLRFLQGMIDYESDKGKKPVDDKDGFYDFVKGLLEVEGGITLSQCTGQMDYFQKKYKKKFFQGKIPSSSSSNTHEKKFFELCEEIWGTKFAALEKSRKSVRVQIKEEKDVIDLECGVKDWFGKRKDVLRLVTAFGIEEDFVKQMWTLVPTKQKKKMEKKWSALKQKEFEMVSNKTSFVTKMVSMMSEASSQ